MFLIDTNVISELRKGPRGDAGVVRFFKELAEQDAQAYLSAVSIGELARGVELIRHRRDHVQAELLRCWLETVLNEYDDYILEFGKEEARIWGYLRVPNPENALDKQIAATALSYDLTLVTRNVRHLAATGARLLNPFTPLND